MKRKIILTVCLFLLSLISFAGRLVLIPVNETNNLMTLFDNRELKIHYYCDNYVLATTEEFNYEDVVVLDNNAFADTDSYAIVYCTDDYKNEYLTKIAESGKILYSGNNFLIMQVLSKDFMPAKNDGMIAIRDIKAQLPRISTVYPVITEQNEDVLDYMLQVSADRIMDDIQTLQDFVTRNCQHPNIFNVRDWLKKQYEKLDLEVTLHHFPYFDNDNVIAIQYGTEFPNEYVVCGAHYDATTLQSIDISPGADDNASGTAGILETARILSQYDFKRSIIYCAFSAEEHGLYGSGYYAEQCATQNMNIVGYFNLDMTGYLAPEHEIRIDVNNSTSSQTLADYFINICKIYFPELPVESSTSHYGGSDYVSFSNVGYRAIHPHEDHQTYNPYIHTPGDTIGVSVNSPDLTSLFTQANIASIATLAMYDVTMPPLPLVPPTNCIAEYYSPRHIKIRWEAPVENYPVKYYVYMDGEKVAELTNSALSYISTLPVNDYNEHCYTLTASYGLFGESDFSNESCASIPTDIIELNSRLNIYPNPTTGELRIENSELKIEKVEIYDVLGVTYFLHWGDLGGLDISHLPAGIYFLRIQTDKGMIIRKILKICHF